MKKLAAITLAVALSLAAVSGFAKGKGVAYPACKDLKGKERTECIKTEKAKKVEAKQDVKSTKETKTEAKAPVKKDIKTEAKAPAEAAH